MAYHALQYYSFFWLTRLLLTPFLVVVVLRVWHIANHPYKLFNYSVMVFFAYNFLGWAISFISCRFLAPGYDGRNKNLFDTIKYESTLLNLLIYLASILLVFTWLYYERDKKAAIRSIELEESLAGLKCNLAQLQNSIPVGTANEKFNFITVKNGNKTILLPIPEISCIQSNGPYIKILSENGNYLMKRSLSEFQKTLPASFIRVHRSSIVNIEFVKELRSLLNGDTLLILKNEKEVRSSRTYRAEVLGVLGKG